MTGAEPGVVAVIVTYNRRELLERAIRAVDSGTRRPERIIVVDNASTDGTSQLLADLRTEAELTVERLAENSGGAGGFARGVDLALEHGAELLWLMDDDGEPAPDCLERLLERRGQFDFFGPAVLSEADSDRLSFAVRRPGTTAYLRTAAELSGVAADGCVAGTVAAFNGVLVTAQLAREIGVPRAEYFIWGDETEYFLRATRAGARIATIVAARFFHPADPGAQSPMFFGRLNFAWSQSELKNYCRCRNHTATLLEYRGRAAVVGYLARLAWFTLLTKHDHRAFALGFGAALAGLRGDFTGHRRFLPSS